MLEAAAVPEDPARVINIGSIAGLSTSRFDNAYAYAASKAAVSHLTRVLAAQLTHRGTSISPHSLINDARTHARACFSANDLPPTRPPCTYLYAVQAST